MDNNVIDIGSYKEQRPETVWECSCGEQLFYIIEYSGGAKCRGCGKVIWFAIGDDRGSEE